MRLLVLMSLLAIMLSGANDSDNPSEDIFGPFYNGYMMTCQYNHNDNDHDNNMTRVVSVHYLDGESHVPCEVRYHKPTEQPDTGYRVLWHAHNTEGYCERKAELLVKRLEGWGWQCWEPIWYKGDTYSRIPAWGDSQEPDNPVPEGPREDVPMPDDAEPIPMPDPSEESDAPEESSSNEESSETSETTNSSAPPSASPSECDLYGGFYCN